MKPILLYLTIIIGAILIAWALMGNKSWRLVLDDSMWWCIPAFVFCSFGAIFNLIIIIKHFR